MKGARQTGKGGACPRCHIHGAGCLGDANRTHKFRDPEGVKERPMKRKRKGKGGKREVMETTVEAKVNVLKVVSQGPGTRQIIASVDGAHPRTFHQVDGNILVWQGLREVQVDTQSNEDGTTRPIMGQRWVREFAHVR